MVDIRPRRKRRRRKKQKRNMLSLFFFSPQRLPINMSQKIFLSTLSPYYHHSRLLSYSFFCLYRTILFVLSITTSKHSCMPSTRQRHLLRILSPAIIHMEKEKDIYSDNTCQMRKHTSLKRLVGKMIAKNKFLVYNLWSSSMLTKCHNTIKMEKISIFFFLSTMNTHNAFDDNSFINISISLNEVISWLIEKKKRKEEVSRCTWCIFVNIRIRKNI